MGCPSVSRRAVLRTAAGLGLASLAGCSGDGGTAATPTPSEDSVFREITYEGSNLVVRLREDHEVTRLNLIAPDGSLFTQTSVATGVTKVSIPILDIRPQGGGYRHYEPGKHELVASFGEKSESTVLHLQPKLRIANIEQFRGGEYAADLGLLATTVENTGTAPTWVYDITTRNAPNNSANVDLGSDPGIPQVGIPKQLNELILGPSERQTYVGMFPPLLFTSQSSPSCRGEHEFTVLVGNAAGPPLKRRIIAKLGGEAKAAGLLNEYACTDIEVGLHDGGSK